MVAERAMVAVVICNTFVYSNTDLPLGRTGTMTASYSYSTEEFYPDVVNHGPQ